MKVKRTNKNIFSCIQHCGQRLINKIQKKAKKNVYLYAFASTTTKFCRNTTLHGLKHILGDGSTSSYSDSRRFVWISISGLLYAELTPTELLQCKSTESITEIGKWIDLVIRMHGTLTVCTIADEIDLRQIPIHTDHYRCRHQQLPHLECKLSQCYRL